MNAWKVWALRAGRSAMDRSFATYLQGMGKELVIPHTMFVLQGPRLIVVDTSFESVDAVKSAYPQEVWRDADEEPLALLAQLDIQPDDVPLVVCTHLHYDHCGSNRLFSRARVIAQRRELEYARDPIADIMDREFFSPGAGFTPPYDPNQFALIDGDLDLGDGLQIVLIPGHTPGLQGVIVPTARGRVGLLGDHVMVHENWRDNVPVGLHTDLDGWYRSMGRVRNLVDDVVPSHDMRVFGSDSPIAEVA